MGKSSLFLRSTASRLQRFLRHQGAVDGETDLSAVAEPALGDLGAHGVDVGIQQDERGAFAAEFEDDRREMRRRGGENLATDLGATSEEELVPGQRGDVRRDLGVALDNRRAPLVEALGDEFLEQGRETWRRLGRLDDHTVAGGESLDRWVEGEADRRVER